MAVVEETTNKLNLPTKENISQFEKDVKQTHGEARGTGNLYKAIAGYRNATRLANQHWDQVLRSVAYLNGERLQKQADTAESTARKFFGNLSTVMLKQQCSLYDVDFDLYEEIDDIIDALVEAQGWNNQDG